MEMIPTHDLSPLFRIKNLERELMKLKINIDLIQKEFDRLVDTEEASPYKLNILSDKMETGKELVWGIIAQINELSLAILN